jgi:hypothetical protein
VRTRYSRNELLVTLAGEVYVGIAVEELVRCLGRGEVVQHGLLHRELLAKMVAVLSRCAQGMIHRQREMYEPCRNLCLGAT